MVSPTDQTFAAASERKIVPKNIDNRYHRLNASTTEKLILTKKTTMIDEESTEPTWGTSGTLIFLISLFFFSYIQQFR
jgi:hypothetical protein